MKHELVGQRVSKSGKNDNDRPIYRLPKGEKGWSIGQAPRSDSLLDRTVRPIGWAVRSADSLIDQQPGLSVRCDDFRYFGFD